MAHQRQKHRHSLPAKASWQAWLRVSPKGSDPQTTSTESEALRHWLNAGGKADNALDYNVEIFVANI
jgi:hypothetical protein